MTIEEKKLLKKAIFIASRLKAISINIKSVLEVSKLLLIVVLIYWLISSLLTTFSFTALLILLGFVVMCMLSSGIVFIVWSLIYPFTFVKIKNFKQKENKFSFFKKFL